MPEEIKSPQEKSMLSNLTKFQIIMIIVCCAYLLLLSNMTRKVPNTFTVIENNQTVTKVIYTNQDLVPRSNIDFGYALAGMVLIGMLVLSFLLYSQKRTDRLSERELKEILSKELEKKMKAPLAGKFHEFSNLDLLDIFPVITKYRKEDAERKASQCTFGIKFKEKDTNVPRYYKIRMHPYLGLIDDIIPTDFELLDSDRCPKCGTEASERLIMSSDLIRLRSAERFVKRDM